MNANITAQGWPRRRCSVHLKGLELATCSASNHATPERNRWRGLGPILEMRQRCLFRSAKEGAQLCAQRPGFSFVGVLELWYYTNFFTEIPSF